MKESYDEGVATRIGPESCVVGSDPGGEALTGVRAGPVWSREIHAPGVILRVLRGADAVEESGRSHRARRHRKVRPDPARSETRCMHGSLSHGNREIPRSSGVKGTADRIGKSEDARR
jgi:hypothetical protein